MGDGNGGTGAADRLNAAGEAADKMPDAPVDNCVQSCDGCADCWKKVDAERDAIATIPDPEERNRKISAAYARLYEGDKKLTWIGLAAVVSRQAGCAMQYADKAITDAQGGLAMDKLALQTNPMAGGQGGIGVNMIIHSKQLESAQTAKEALGEANKRIFTSMYPAARFRELYGLDKLKECRVGPDGKNRVPDRLMQSFDKMQSGTPRDLRSASDLMAEQEQREIVEKQVYQVQKYKDVLEDNENYSSWKRLWIGRLFGAKPAQIPLSSNCQGKEIPFDGSILNPDDRVNYYNKLMDEFQAKNQAWRDQTMNDILQQGK